MESVIRYAWPEWRVERKIGSGSYGKVFLCVKQEHTVTVSAAVKVIAIPSSEAEVEALRADGMREESTRAYFRAMVDNCVNEIKILEAVKGAPNIVHIEDFKVIERIGQFGWYILIRMELLGSLSETLSYRNLTYDETCRLGVDVCNALEVCHRNKIIHRDIKPANIMESKNGGYKLTDFGIARQLDNMRVSMSQKGTYLYMAPEVASLGQYDERADIYSLGLVMYQLFNRNHPPFTDLSKPELSPQDKETSVRIRMSGTQLPYPCDAGQAMAQVVMRACAFHPAERFSSVVEMRSAIQAAKQADLSGSSGMAAPVKQTPDHNKAGSADKLTIALASGVGALAITLAVLLFFYFT